MARLDIQPPAPGDELATAEAIRRLIDEADGKMDFGSPQDPGDVDSTTLAGSTAAAHPGTVANMRGAWAEADVTALDTAVTFHHNLGITAQSATANPNVRALHFLYEHDGTGVTDGTAVVSYNYETGDAITDDAIELRFYAAGGRTVDGTHPLRVSLFFTPAVR